MKQFLNKLNIILALLSILILLNKVRILNKELKSLKKENEILRSLIEDVYKCDDVFIFKGGENHVYI